MQVYLRERLWLYFYCAKHRQRDEAMRNRAGVAHASSEADLRDGGSASIGNDRRVVYRDS